MAQVNTYLFSGDPNADPIEVRAEIVGDDNSKTTHQVRISQEYYQKLTGGIKPAEDLVKASFEFLLEREPKESILQNFDLSQIQDYFPEYETVISAQMAK